MGFIHHLLNKIFGVKKIRRIQVDSGVIDEIINAARNAYPMEFAALLEGRIEDDTLKVTGLIFLPGETSDEGAIMQILMLPPFTSTIGSVHSHPSPNNSPSIQDLHFFEKNGFFHMIIAHPYTEDTIASYNRWGERIEFEILKGA